MEFAADIETRFDVSIPPDLYDRIVTVEDVAKVVVSLSSGSPLVREKSPH